LYTAQNFLTGDSAFHVAVEPLRDQHVAGPDGVDRAVRLRDLDLALDLALDDHGDLVIRRGHRSFLRDAPRR
jgi:hypothetical protein